MNSLRLVDIAKSIFIPQPWEHWLYYPLYMGKYLRRVYHTPQLGFPNLKKFNDLVKLSAEL